MGHARMFEGSVGGRPVFVVTTDTGYRAELPMCGCDRRGCPRVEGHPVEVDLPADMPKHERRWRRSNTRREHDRTHCHARFGRHREHAEAFIAAVERTYRR